MFSDRSVVGIEFMPAMRLGREKRDKRATLETFSSESNFSDVLPSPLA